jgi:hypothetical protein
MIAEHLKAGFTNCILSFLRKGHSRFGLEVPAIRVNVAPEGYAATPDEIADRLEYLASKGLAEEVPKVMAQADRAWKITDAGRRYLDEHNL